MEKAADDFATKFPDSELRVLLYKAAMRGYQNANNADKMSEMAQKLLKLDPDDPEALVAAAEVIAERTRDTDLDKDQRYDQATKYAQHALETVDTDVAIPAGTPQSQIDAYKGGLALERIFGSGYDCSTVRKSIPTRKAISASRSMLIPPSRTQ